MEDNISLEFNNEELVSVKDFSKICRICLLEIRGTPFVDLFFEDKMVTDILSSHLVIEVNLDDLLPQNICNHCKTEVLKMCSLIDKCQKADALLRSYLKFSLEDAHIEINNEELIKDIAVDSKNSNKNKLDVVVQDVEVNCANSSSKVNVEVVGNNSDIGRDEIVEKEDKDKQSLKVCKSQCPTCLKYLNKKHLKRHIMMVHTDERQFECLECFKTFKTKAHLIRHRMIHTEEQPHICEICGKAYSQGMGLAIHRKTHVSYEQIDSETGIRNFTCLHCGKIFKRSAYYIAHLKKHVRNVNVEIENEDKASTDQNEKLYSCPICKKSYKIRSSLYTHQLLHREKSFLCNTCGKRFSRKAALEQHLITHTTEKPHNCKFCDKSFARLISLEMHLLIHTGQKFHVCNICEKSFTQANHLKYHILTHTGEKAYECSYCEKRFAVKGNLTVHVRTHTGERPYMCSGCDKSFYDSSSMKKHQKRHEKLTIS